MSGDNQCAYDANIIINCPCGNKIPRGFSYLLPEDMTSVGIRYGTKCSYCDRIINYKVYATHHDIRIDGVEVVDITTNRRYR